ncbi:unnamed protein product [Brassica oleracea var. botrytis]
MTINKCTCEFKQHHIPHGKECARKGLSLSKILSQENKIQRFNEQVQDLRRQLVQCRNENQVELTELVTELDQLPLSCDYSTNFVMSPLMAEGLAMREAIRKSKELGIRRL